MAEVCSVACAASLAAPVRMDLPATPQLRQAPANSGKRNHRLNKTCRRTPGTVACSVVKKAETIFEGEAASRRGGSDVAAIQ